MALVQPQGGRINEFVAAFDSDCHTCTNAIYEGERAGYLPGDTYASCSECIEDYQEGRILDE
jgi:hypothetical protein